MSQKTSKVERIKENKKMVDDWKVQRDAMIKAQTEKMDGSIQHFLQTMRNSVAQFKTVNGYMKSFYTLKDTDWENTPANLMHNDAVKLAQQIAVSIDLMAGEFEQMKIEDYHKFLDERIDEDFINGKFTYYEAAYELLLVEFLQNCKPALEDIIGFWENSNEQLKAIEAAIKDPQKALREAQEAGKVLPMGNTKQ